MTMDEEAAWRRRIEWKLDRLGHHLTRLLLASETQPPALPVSPPAAPRHGRLRGMVLRILMRALRSAGEKLLTFAVPYLLPPIVSLALLGRDGLLKLRDALVALLSAF